MRGALRPLLAAYGVSGLPDMGTLGPWLIRPCDDEVVFPTMLDMDSPPVVLVPTQRVSASTFLNESPTTAYYTANGRVSHTRILIELGDPESLWNYIAGPMAHAGPEGLVRPRYSMALFIGAGCAHPVWN